MFRTLLICVGLSACVASGGDLVSPATGLAGSYSRQMVISDHPHHVLYGHVVSVARAGADPVQALVISHRRDGVHYLRYSEAWQDGRALPFRRMTRRLGCSHGHCRNDAVGLIALGDGMIAHAARDGLNASLIGPSGRIDIHAPARLFSGLAPPVQP